jgi:phosphoserine phosphatase RsbX
LETVKVGNPTRALVDWGAATFTLPGQPDSGDRYVVAPFGPGVLVAAIDGLGHGDAAAAAAQLAASILGYPPHESVIALVRRCHERLRSTRGVVMSLATFTPLDETMTWIGVGNVEGRLKRAAADGNPLSEFLLLRAGVVGSQLPMLQAAVLPVSPGDTLVFATDGVALPTALEMVAGERPQALADRILAKHRKGTDDALILVVRWVGVLR